MTAALSSLDPAVDSASLGWRPRVVVCGSFRRDAPTLRQHFNQLQSMYDVLSPLSVDFVDPTAAFVRLAHEVGQAESDIEERHVQAIAEADFVWLHAPEGYVGPSAMYELGCARTMGIPVFATTAPSEAAFAHLVHIVANPREIQMDAELNAPGKGLRSLQRYYERTALRRGWADESAQDTLLLMTEEMGELARAIRKSVGLARDGDWEGQGVAEELADVQLYLVHLANNTGVDLADAVTAKELVNAARSAARSQTA